jgi:hypothetical protein
MYEKDWRTIAKSLHILHTIARDCQPDACERFSFALRDMAKTRNPKKPDQRYFDANCLSDLDDNSSEYEEYIKLGGGAWLRKLLQDVRDKKQKG